MKILKPNNPFLVGGILLIIILAIFALQSTKNFNINEITPIETKNGLQKAPELQKIHNYINTEPDIKIADLKGKVVLVDFWTYSCINCIRTLPYLKDWHEKYSDNGLVIIGVHSPEFEFEKNFDNVKQAVEKHQLKYPVVLDNDFGTWRAYNNRWWPHKFLIDSQGFIRYDHIGEGGYEETEKQILKLLSEKDETVKEEESNLGSTENPDFSQIGTPEIYFGYKFIRAPFGNKEGFKKDAVTEYSLPDTFIPNLAYLDGEWETKADFSKLVSDKGKVALTFKAKNVNIVAGSPDKSNLTIELNQNPLTEENTGTDVQNLAVPVEEQKLYNLVSSQDYSQKTIVFEVTGKGFELYTFTFG